MNHGLLIWDLDGTLIDTVPLYFDAIDRYSNWLSTTYNFPFVEVKDTFMAYDARKAQEEGFSRHRFPKSMEDIALEFWHSARIDVTDDMRKEARAFGYSVFRHKAHPFSDTYRVLTDLGEYFGQHLLTMGDEEVQNKRINDAGLRSFFLTINIVPRKSPEVLQAFIAQHKYAPRHIWMIGDSLRSDINPAIACGVNAIHIAGPTWAYEAQDIDAKQYLSVATLADAAIHLLNYGVPRVREVASA